MERVDAILDALTRAARESTSARDTWLLSSDDDGKLRVAAAVGDVATGHLGHTFPCDVGVEGFVFQSGQPVALSSTSEDARLQEGVLAKLQRKPESVLCVACEEGEGTMGVLLLADKVDESSFTLDDVDITTVLGDVAAVALSYRAGGSRIPSPAELAGELTALATSDPVGYARLAPVISTFLQHG